MIRITDLDVTAMRPYERKEKIMKKFNGKILTAVAVIVCAGSVYAFPRPHGFHHHHHHCGGRGLFEGLAIAGTAMAGAALVSDIVATQRAASQPQTVVVQQPAPVVVQPAPVVVQQPAPVVVQQPVATTVVRGGVVAF